MTEKTYTDIEEYRKEALALIASANSLEDLDKIRVATIGRNGTVTEAIKELWSKKKS